MDERFFPSLEIRMRRAMYTQWWSYLCGYLKFPRQVRHELLVASESIEAFLLPVAEGVKSFSQIATLCHVLR